MPLKLLFSLQYMCKKGSDKNKQTTKANKAAVPANSDKYLLR